jgi:O-antigen ligase
VTPSGSTSLARRAAAFLLAAVLVLLAFRLTANETLRDTISQKVANAVLTAEPPTPDNPGPVPMVGPTFTAAYAAIAFLLAAAAALTAQRVSPPRLLGRRHLGQLALIALLLGLLLVSTLHAENRFNAIVGTADMATALVTAWTVAVLCQDGLLGMRGRQAVIAAIVALCAVGCARALVQKYVDYPDTLKMVAENPDEALRNNGINPDDPVQKTLFLNRLRGQEVTGYGALANVFATQMVAGVALLTGLVAAGIWLRRQPTAPAAKGRRPRPPPRVTPPREEIPLRVIWLVIVGVLLAACLAVLQFTGSKGGLAAAVLAVAAIVPGVKWRQIVAARRRFLLTSVIAAAVVLPIVVIGWGVTHHRLPTRSLLFRWQYWTASVPMMERSPAWGVGLHNFGDYYKRYKLPSSPEDVGDPHSFFVRLLAETGVPATLAVGALLVWMLQGAWRRPSARAAGDANAAEGGIGMPLLLAMGALLAWLPLHFLTEFANEYTITLTFLFALLAWGVFAVVMALWAELEENATRIAALVAVVGALAMLLYDQVNMALVTGPVAMLFWIMLAVGDSCTASVQNQAPPGSNSSRKTSPLLVVPAGLLAVSLVTAAMLWIPLSNDRFAWDPAPYEYAYIRAAGDSHWEKARAAIDAAIERSPNTAELRVQRIVLLHDKLHLPVADDIRKVFELDRANAGPRLLLALPDLGLPPAERIAALEDALKFDSQLESYEPKRLTARQIRDVEATIARLRPAATSRRVE